MKMPSQGPFTILVLGGSQGARGVNGIVMKMLPALEDFGKGIRFIHVAGPGNREPVAEAYARHRIESHPELVMHIHLTDPALY